MLDSSQKEKKIVNVIKALDLKIGRLSWIIWENSIYSNHTSPLKQKFLGWSQEDAVKGEGREIQDGKGNEMRVAGSLRRWERLSADS